MKVSQGHTELGIEVGNHYDKYGTKNPIAQYLMQGFTKSLDDLVKKTNVNTVHEIGCGEGHWVMHWQLQGKQVRGCDFSNIAIAMATQNAKEMQLPVTTQLNTPVFMQKSIYDLSEIDEAPLVVCCEVLEHLEYPIEALKSLLKIAKPWLILSVPREPVWSVLNLMRGKYLKDLGNTPGHIQRWSKSDFIHMVNEYAQIIEVKSPLPWTMLLCKAKFA